MPSSSDPKKTVAVTFLLLTLVTACSPDSMPDPGDGGNGDAAQDATLVDAPVDAVTPDVAADANGDGSDGASSDGASSDGASSDGASSDGASSDGASDGGIDAAPDADGGSSSDGGSVSCSALCGAGTKLCDGRCVGLADPAYGCGGGSCSPCGNGFLNGTPACQNGACAVGSCRPGYADCDGNPANGCEADLRNPATCLTCNTQCAVNQVCTATGCASACPFPYTACTGGVCRDLSSDPNACGACNTPCVVENGATATCSGATCSKTCNAGFTSCAGQCKHTQDDPSACGSGCAVCPVPTHGAATCAGGSCGFACQVGYAKCNGACVNYFSDDANCGGCGVTCSQGQTCLAGTCTNPASARVVTGLSAPQDLTVDGTNVYFTDTGTNAVTQANKSTWATTLLGSAQAKPYRITVDGTHVYWSSNLGGAILRAPIGGGTSPTVLYSAQQPRPVAVDSSFVYWADATAHWRAPKAGGGQPTLVANQYANSALEYQSNAKAVYGWNDVPSATYAIDKATGTYSLLLAEVVPYYGMAVNSSWVYYVRKFGGITTGIMGLPVGGSNTVAIATVPSTTAAPMVADDCGTFWSVLSEIWMRPEGTNVYLRVTNAGTQVVRIALDSTYVYWTDAGGFIGRVPRP